MTLIRLHLQLFLGPCPIVWPVQVIFSTVGAERRSHPSTRQILTFLQHCTAPVLVINLVLSDRSRTTSSYCNYTTLASSTASSPPFNPTPPPSTSPTEQAGKLSRTPASTMCVEFMFSQCLSGFPWVLFPRPKTCVVV